MQRSSGAAGAPWQEARPGRDGIAFLALAAFGVAMYSVPAEWIPALREVRFALITSGVAAGMMLLRRLGRMEPVFFDGPRGLALIGFVALALASSRWSVAPEVSRDTAFELVKLLAIYLTIVNVVTTWRRLGILAGALVLASIITSIGVIRRYNSGLDLVEGFRAAWVGVYADPNHMAMDLGLIVPLAVAFFARKTGGWPFRLACGAAAILAVTAVVLSHSRGGFIGLSVAMGLWAFREKRRVQAIVVGLLFVVGLLLFAPESFWARNETVTRFEEDASAMGRVYAWQVASRMSLDHPMLGVGVGAFRFAWPLYAPPEATRAYVAHNVFLDVIGELGFVGLALFLVFIGGAAGGAFRASSHPERGWLARALGAALAGYLVCDLFSGYILSAHFYVLFGMSACADRLARGVGAPAHERTMSAAGAVPQV